jgi:hypothetical protein
VGTLDSEQGSAPVERDGGTEIAELVQAVAHDLDTGARGVALGFECLSVRATTGRWLLVAQADNGRQFRTRHRPRPQHSPDRREVIENFTHRVQAEPPV